MLRSLGLTVALTVSASAVLMPAEAGLADRSLPMRFELRLPAESCGAPCRFLISARGSITADSAADFRDFAKATGRDLRHGVVVLDSDGGSVHGAIDLGREIRQFELDATVGKLIDVASAGETRARLSPRADCESMCAFVLLGGVHRMVPRDSRVMVHQIWLGDRREDPAASNYSAEDLVLVQRDIGKLAVYAAEMGASAGLLDLSLRIPPWEPMHVMTAGELRDTGLVTTEPEGPPALMASLLPVAAPVLPGPANGSRVDAIGERRWSLMQRAGVAVLSRRHPLTADGETIGSFDLNVSCGKSSGVYDVLYVEHRGGLPRLSKLGGVTLQIGGADADLQVTSSERQGSDLVTRASGRVKAASIDGFAAAGHHSMLIATRIGSIDTAIRLGNTGAQAGLPELAKACAAGGIALEPSESLPGDRAELSPRKGVATGGPATAP